MNTFAKFKLGGFVIHSTEDLQTRAPSKMFADVAIECMQLPRSAERSVALRKLLEGKDAAVRAAL